MDSSAISVLSVEARLIRHADYKISNVIGTDFEVADVAVNYKLITFGTNTCIHYQTR